MPGEGCGGSGKPVPEGLCVVLACREDMVLLLNPGLGDRLVVGSTDQLLGAFAPPGEPALQPAHWREASEPEHQRGLRLCICHDKVGAVGVLEEDGGGQGGPVSATLTLLQPVTQVTWHGRGDYMAVVLATSGHTQVLIHQLSRRRSQSPFRRSHGQVQRVAFHPVRPFLLAASQRSVRLYHLLRQELTKKLVPNCKWVSSLAVHPAGGCGCALEVGAGAPGKAAGPHHGSASQVTTSFVAATTASWCGSIWTCPPDRTRC